MKRVPPLAPPNRSRSWFWWIMGALLVVTCAVYAQVGQFEFVNFDDPEYVTDNAHVKRGFTWDGVAWALTSGEASNWFPVTRLSHMLDCEMFSLDSGMHHLSNLLFHALATVVLFALLQRATHATWPSAFVALVFALHPLHVESVAWVSERKDVLSALFWMLTLWTYVRYAERPDLRRYLMVAAMLLLALMAKPMAVTLPFVLLLVDLWPFRRLSRKTVIEKIPLIALSGVVSVVTYAAQKSSGAMQGAEAFPIGLRIENALLTYVVYIWKTLWPADLAVFYPYPAEIAFWKVATSFIALALVTGWVMRVIRPQPYLAVGWFWYLGTLVPVIGLVQVGEQARADRYTYIPMVGLAIMAAWGADAVVRLRPRLQRTMAAIGIAACAAVTSVTWVQISHWKNTESLFKHALEVTSGNYLAHQNLGSYLANVPGRVPEAVSHFQEALRIKPDSPKARNSLGIALAKLPGGLNQAVTQYEEAVRLQPNAAIPHNNLGIALSQIPGRLEQAIAEYETALRLDPNYPEAHNNLGVALSRSGRLAEAIPHFEAAVRLKPDYAEAHYDLGVGLSRVPGRAAEAISHFETALGLQPDYAEAHNNLAIVLANMPGRMPDAIAHFEAAVRAKPDYAAARENLQRALDQLKSGKK